MPDRKHIVLNALFCSTLIFLSTIPIKADPQGIEDEYSTCYQPLLIELEEQTLNTLTGKQLEWWQTPAIIAIGAVIVAIIGIVGGRMSVGWQVKANREILSDELKIRHINEQLNIFYGPLLALTAASNELWDAFAKDIGRSNTEGEFFQKNQENVASKPTADQLEAWKRVMKEVFLPINQQREKLVLEHAALIDRDSQERIPGDLVTMVSHISEFRSVMSRWTTHRSPADTLEIFNEKGEREFRPNIAFPATKITAYAQNEYARLKREQANLYSSLHSGTKKQRNARKRQQEDKPPPQNGKP